VDICEQIASTKAIDLAIRYALRASKTALAKKLETIADAKSDSKDSKEDEEMENHQDNFTSNSDFSINNEEDNDVLLPSIKKPEVEIKPLSMSQTLKRVNPFLKAGNSSLSPRGNTYILLLYIFIYIHSAGSTLLWPLSYDLKEAPCFLQASPFSLFAEL